MALGLSARRCFSGSSNRPQPVRLVRRAQRDLVTSRQTCAQQHFITRLRASEDDKFVLEGFDAPETAKEAIDMGLALTSQEKWEQALPVFEKALTLPGTGLKRFRDKPRLISDGEKQAALYNIACCYSKLGDARTGLVALAGCLEQGYDDFQQIRQDPDLAFLRSDERFEGLLARFEPRAGAGFLGLGGLFGGKK